MSLYGYFELIFFSKCHFINFLVTPEIRKAKKGDVTSQVRIRSSRGKVKIKKGTRRVGIPTRRVGAGFGRELSDQLTESVAGLDELLLMREKL